ncbi:BsuPI-related putative proteinase inhibitor [Natronorubrum halophilum]|uniref:BsuPI-related putative proteinase inhibitor n=1 Tax=Natronorubrum halophilum TaxID=1702106 RepID=UPI0010C16964|nr:BsuPI-related putative proteinase inhibitor [Natronorubrum halophilum]
MTLEGSLEAAVDGATDAVSFAFTVTNEGAEPVELRFTDACKAEFVVSDDGNERWRFTEGRLFAQVLGSETLAPDESATYEAEWSAAEPGEYTALAELRAKDENCEARTALSVPS